VPFSAILLNMQDTGNIAARLVPTLEPLQDIIAENPWRVVPSSFISTDPNLRALPLPMEWRWPSLAGALAALEVHTLILQQPGFWQVEPFAFDAARTSSIPVCNIEPQNYPLDRAAIRFAEADGILAEASEGAAIAEYLQANNVTPLRAWVLIHPADSAQWETPPTLVRVNAAVAHEVHLAPGVPLLVQCTNLAKGNTPRFHRSSIFTWSDDFAAPTITTDVSLPFALTDFALPFSLADEGTCACGEQIVSRA
jgi:hypothetical protein